MSFTKKIIALFSLGVFVLGVTVVNASPSNFRAKAATSSATSTVVYMTAGTATTTLVYDAYAQDGSNQTKENNTFATDSAVLKVQFTASSTLSTLNVNLEFSDDTNCKTNPTGCDWYQNNLESPFATTSPVVQLQVANSYSWGFASSTQGMVGGSANRVNKIVGIQTPTRFVRAVFTLPVGSYNGAVYAEIVPKKQTPIY